MYNLSQQFFTNFFTFEIKKFRAVSARLVTENGADTFQKFSATLCKSFVSRFTAALQRCCWSGSLAAGCGLAYLNPFSSKHGLGQRLELLYVYAETEAGNTIESHLKLALLTALLLQSYALLLIAARPITAIFAFLGYLLLLLPPFFAMDGDYLGIIHLLIYPGAILIFFAFAALTTDQRGS